MTTDSADIQNELVMEMALCAKDPYRFAMFAFPWGEKGTILENHDGPEDWQADILKAVRDGLVTVAEAIQIAVASGHGIGKSALVGMLIMWAVATREDTVGVVTANTETQLKTKTWRELKIWHGLCIVGHWFKCTATSLYSLAPGHEKTWRVDMIPWSDSKPDAFAGLHNKGKRAIIVFDEASSIIDKIWEVTEGAMTDSDTEIVWACFGNPTRSTGKFRECFRKNKHRWITRQIDSRSVSLTNKTKIQQWVDDHGEDSDFVKVRVRGMFPVLSTMQFISEADVNAAFGKHLRKEQYQFAPKILTCDPAWTGADELVIGFRQGLYFQILKTIARNDNDVAVANMLALFEDEHMADAVFIDMGYGTGIVSAGKAMNRNWQLVEFGGASGKPGYLNKRAEMYGEAKAWLKSGGAIPEDQVLYDDLTGIETVERLDGKIQLESKKSMRDRGLPSPGRADALVLSFAQPVVSKNIPQMGPSKAAKARREYQPINGRRR